MPRVLSRFLRPVVEISSRSFFRCPQFRSQCSKYYYSSLSAARDQNDQGFIKDDPNLWVKSPFQDIPTTIGIETHEVLFSRIAQWPNSPAFECGVTGKRLTFGDLYHQSRSFGASLIQGGFKPGDTIGLVLPNIPEFAVIMLGCWSAGLCISCINPAYTGDEIKRQLKSSNATCAVTVEFFLDSVRTARAENPTLKSIIIIGNDGAIDGCHSFSEMIKCDTKGVEFISGSKGGRNTCEDVALLPYSSGTTGPPKGVMLTHTNLVTNLRQFNNPNVAVTRNFDETGQQERLIGLLPFFHSYGSAVFLISGLYQGSFTMSLPKFDPNTFLDAVRKHKPTTLHLVTPLISMIVNSDDYTKKEFENVHSVVGAAAPIGKVLIDRMLEKIGKYAFFAEGYGMTELSPLSHFLTKSTRNTKSGSCGTGVPSTWSKVIDTTTGETLGPNCRGELLVKGPQVMKGYYNNEIATSNTIDTEGWLHTGDIAYYDDEGFFYIVDRLKELIKVKGFQVAPSELEDVLRKHEKIEDVAVIGVKNEQLGEAPRAYIVKKAKTNLTEEEVHTYLKPILASFKQLKGGIEFCAAIPKAPSGKILRRELVEDYRKKNGY